MLNNFFKKYLKSKFITILILLTIIVLLIITYYVLQDKLIDTLPIIISFISIIISFISIIPVINNIFEKLYLDIYLANQKPLILYFNKGGSYLSLKIALHSINKPCIITDMKINIVNNTTNNEFEFEWGYFKDPTNAWTSGNGIINSNILNIASFSRPIEINTNSTKAYEIEFYNSETENFKDPYNKLKETADEILKNNYNNISIDKVIDEIKNDNKINCILEKDIEKFNIWKSGEYTISLKVEYNKTNYLKRKYKFQISTDQCIDKKHILDLIVSDFNPYNTNTIKNIEINKLVEIDS